MSRFPGNIIKLPNVTPTQSSAQGVWSLKDQLVYQRNNQWPFQRDPYFNYTTLLLQGNVPNTTGPQAMTQPLAYNSDASTNNFLVTPNGDVSPRPFSPYGGGNYSVYFSGSPYLSSASNAAFGMGAGDYTIECWLYITASSSYDGIYSTTGTTSSDIQIQLNNRLLRVSSYTGQIVIASSGTEVSLNTWTHVAFCRSGTTLRLFKDGVQVGSGTDSTTWATGAIEIGRVFGSLLLTGYMSNLRVVKGSALYTSNFTPPAQPLQNITNTSLLTCQSNRFIDNGTANSGSGFTITTSGTPRVTDNSPFVSTDFTTGAGYFDGTTDWLETETNSAFQLGTDSFTIEWWYYGVANNNGNYLFRSDNGTLTSGMMLYFDGTNFVAYGSTSSGSWNVWSGSTVVSGANILNRWTHLALVRSGSTFQWYVNGNLATTGNNSSSAVVQTANMFTINKSNQGYVSNFRYIKGTAIYTGAFTPPAAPLTAITNTQLLTLQTRAASQNIGFIDSSPNEFIVTKNGNTTQGTFSPFSPTGWGAYGSGTTSYAQLNNADYAISTGDFTIEFWMYLTSDKATTCFCSATSNPNLTVAMTGGSSGARLFYMEYGGTGTTFGAGSNYLNKWTHVAFVRSSGVVTCYQDGNATNPGGTTRAAAVGSTANLYLLRNSGDTSQDLPGYVSNFRICKSAVYGANFSPSTSALTTTSQNATNCVLLTFQNNRFRDNSSNNSTVTPSANLSVQAFSPFAPATQSSPLVTGGSGYFDGGSDYLQFTDSANQLDLGGSQASIEFWLYLTNTAVQNILSKGGMNSGSAWSTTDGAEYVFAYNSGVLYFTFNNAGGTVDLTGNFGVNQWNHVVVATNTSNAISMYINGVRTSGPTTNAITKPTTRTTVRVGTFLLANWTYGYLAGIRHVSGSGAYDPTLTNFPIPTAPPTAIPNTSLLLNFTGGGIVDATGKNNLETVANAQISTVQAKWTGAGSMQFDGNGDYLLFPASNLYRFGTGPLTVEFWFFPLSSLTNAGIVDMRASAASNSGLLVRQGDGSSSGTVIYCWLGNPGSTTAATQTGLNLNQWNHVAVVRDNANNVTVYVNGSGGSPVARSIDLTDTNCLIGAFNGATSSPNAINGYMSNVRITRYARYTSNFNTNLPTGPFPLG